MKKFIIIFIILIVVIAAATIYLNAVYLPTKIKFVIISGLEEATGKQVALKTVEFNIFKGLVLKDLSISDNGKAVLEAPEISVTILIPPIFQKKIVISGFAIKSPRIFIERRKDSTFSIQDLVPKSPAAGGAKKQQFGIFVSRITVSSANIIFEDNSLSSPFKKEITNLNLTAKLSLPAVVKFNLNGQITAGAVTQIEAAGEYNIIGKALVSQLHIKNLLPADLRPYYSNTGINIAGGLIDAAGDISFKNDNISAGISIQGKGLDISKDSISMKLNADVLAKLKYDLSGKKLSYSGTATFRESDIAGLPVFERVTGIGGKVDFSDTALSTDKLTSSVWGVPIEAKFTLNDFKNPLLDAQISSDLDLVSAQSLLKDKFKFEIPAEIKGNGKLSIRIQAKLPIAGPVDINGSLDIFNAGIKLTRINTAIEDISGRLEFSPDKMNLKLSSRDLSLDSNVEFSKGLIKLPKLEGKYFDSGLSVNGSVDLSDSKHPACDLKGSLTLDLEDLKKIKPDTDKLNAQGIISTEFTVTGNPMDLKSSEIHANLTCSSLSVYGLKAQNLALGYNQSEYVGDISPASLSLYDGSLKSEARINFDSKEFPFWISVAIDGVKLEKLKLDTKAKEEDIAGTLVVQTKINGICADLTRINGAGQINITEGKLWQLNLFKGLGQLLFDKDFDKIVFNKGSCAFVIQDKYISTENLLLESGAANVDGKVKIGFDSSLDATLNVRILDANLPLTGTFKDITQAIIGTAGRFGIIRITGTTKEPKYKFKPAVPDIINGIKNILFGKN